MQRSGTSTSAAEVTHISSNGLWVLVDDKEYFLSYDHYPWFKNATIQQILNLKRPQPHHLYWPDLDADLELESLLRPEAYPLLYR